MFEILFKSNEDSNYYYYGKELRLIRCGEKKDVIIYDEKTARKAVRKKLLKAYTVIEHERELKHPKGDRQDNKLTLLFVEISDRKAVIVTNQARHDITFP